MAASAKTTVTDDNGTFVASGAVAGSGPFWYQWRGGEASAGHLGRDGDEYEVQSVALALGYSFAPAACASSSHEFALVCRDRKSVV